MTAPVHPDVAAAVLALDQAMIALAVAKSVLLGETGRPVDLAAAEASPANPYGSTKHGRFDAGSEPGLCQSVTETMITGRMLICDRPAGHGGWHGSGDGPEWREIPGAGSAAEVAECVEPRWNCTDEGCQHPGHGVPVSPAIAPFPHFPAPCASSAASTPPPHALPAIEKTGGAL